MAKKIIIVIVVILILGLAGFFAWKKMSRGGKNKTGQSVSEGVQENQGIGGEIKKGLLDLMTTGAGMKCTIEDQQGEYTMYSKGDKAKVEGFEFMPATTEGGQKGEAGTMVNDGNWVYMWSGKEGMKFNIKEMEALTPPEQSQAPADSNSKASDWKDWVKNMEDSGAKYNCGPAVLSDADFVPPTDVKFDDWGEMMKGLMESFQKNMPQIPAGQVPTP